MQRRTRERAARVVAVVCFLVVAVLLAAVGWMVVRPEDRFPDDRAPFDDGDRSGSATMPFIRADGLPA